MGYRLLSLKVPTDYTEEQLRSRIFRKLGIGEFSFTIDRKSLDARRKSDIHWLISVGVSSPELSGGEKPEYPEMKIPRETRNRKALIAGSGPAGMFAALVLQKAGFTTTLIERGKDVVARAEGIETFERGGSFDPKANYLFGEGGAGTFSDGKLTSRSKHIGLERQFILRSYIRAGAPEEIAYMTHPHLGSNNVRLIVQNLRKEYQDLGGTLHFETMLTDLEIRGNRVAAAVTDRGTFDADIFIIAPGHSAYETYRMLIRRGVGFIPKNLALGCRVEHPRALINRAQWGQDELPGVKAAEYRLTSNSPGCLPIYTFCMCPGGLVVPGGAYPEHHSVNGMSFYRRDLPFSNAACVAGVRPSGFLGEEADAEAVLAWVEALERRFYDYSSSFRAPFCGIGDFIRQREPRAIPETSYSPGLAPAPLWELLPEAVGTSLRAGLKEFCGKIRGFETGILLGLESKTSAPLQALRDEGRACPGVENLYIAGEGSGFAGGIISSGADGIKTARVLCGLP